MITAHELKKVICKLNGNKLIFGTYQLHTKTNDIQGYIMRRETILVSITGGSNGSLILHLQDERDCSRLSYEKKTVLLPDDTVVKLYDVFAEHGSIAEVILAFMALEEHIG